MNLNRGDEPQLLISLLLTFLLWSTRVNVIDD